MNSTRMSRNTISCFGLIFLVAGAGCASSGGSTWWSKAHATSTPPESHANSAAALTQPLLPNGPPAAIYPVAPTNNGGVSPTGSPANASEVGPVLYGTALAPTSALSGTANYTNETLRPSGIMSASGSLPDASPAARQSLSNANQKICPVTGQALGSMGSPVVVQYNGTAIGLCCQGCVQKFQSNPAVYADYALSEGKSTATQTYGGSCYGASGNAASCGSCGHH